MSNPQAGSADVNVVVLRGTINAEPTSRNLPSGGQVVQFDVQTRLDDAGRSVTVSSPVVVVDPTAATVADVTAGAQVVVIGNVKRRFFRVGGATQSRTEVVAQSVIPIRRRKQVAVAIEAAIVGL